MAGPTRKCKKCGNYVEGKRRRSLKSKGAQSVFGSIFGSIVGKAAGALADFLEDEIYDFNCPQCGFHWEGGEVENPFDNTDSVESIEIVNSDTNITIRKIQDDYVFFYNNKRFSGIISSSNTTMKIKIQDGNLACFYHYYPNGQLAKEFIQDYVKCYNRNGNLISEDEFEKLNPNFEDKLEKELSLFMAPLEQRMNKT